MSGRYENGFDYFQTSQSGSTICAILNEEGWYFPLGLGGPFDPAGAVSCVSPGRYGYGKRLRHNWYVQSGQLNPGEMLATRFLTNSVSEGWTSIGMKIGNDCYHSPMIAVYDLTGNAFMASVTFEVNGVVSVWKGAPYASAALASSDAGVWRYGVDMDVEVHWVISPSSGSVEVRIHTLGAGGSAAGSVPAVHAVNVDTQPTSATQFNGVGFGWVYRNGTFTGIIDVYWDDFRFYDTAGSINNTWLGTMRVQTLLAASNGSITDFTRSNTGLANWQNIGNLNIDDTLYLYDSTVGDYNLSIPQPLVNSPMVAWLGMLGFYRQDDATQHFVKNRISSAGVIADGASFATPQTYSGDHDVFETDPNTGVQFTGAGVNALQFGPLYYA